MILDEKRCAGQVHNSYGVGFHRCRNRGVVAEQGKLWCRVHAPSAVKARDEMREKRFRREMALTDARHYLHQAERRLLNFIRKHGLTPSVGLNRAHLNLLAADRKLAKVREENPKV